MHSHLVTIEVRIVSGAHERVDTNGLSFDENRLKCLYRKTMQCRSTIQHNWMTLSNFFEDIPNFRSLPLDELLCAANGMNITKFLETADDKWLEKNERHFFG